MHRVITQSHDHRGKRIVEAGPWLVSEAEAQNWAAILRNFGYVTHVERLQGTITGGQAGRPR